MKITFTATTQFANDVLDPPSLAKSSLPRWYKDMPRFMNGDKPGLSETVNATNRTLRGCIPMLDAMTHGYVWKLPNDVQIELIDGNKRSFRWRSDNIVVTPHNHEQHPGLPAPSGAPDASVAKWHGDFVISTPKGWSTMFTHPLNRHDLPFRTFSGLVDTDEYPLAVHFPFQMLDVPTNPYIIEAGTPVVQFFPVKRENWESRKGEYSAKMVAQTEHHFLRKIVASYKNQYWSRKSFR